MCTSPSYSRSAMLRRQCDPVDVIQGLFNSKSRRNLSASILHTEKIVGRDGFLTWLKDIFNKSAKDKNHKADTVIIDRATTFNRPEIATSMRPADFSDKVDVINQKVANLQSMTKFEYGNIRAKKRDADNGERAYAIQQSAIYDTSQSRRFAAGKTSEREIGPDSSRRDPGKMYRSERNGGAIEFAARNDLDVASYYRCYTSPRHCYRLPPQRTKQPPLGLCVPNRYINMSTRTIMAFAPRNSKPPIKEPNAPEKREKKDEKKDRKEKEKPVIRTDGESVSVDSSERRAEIVADDNPRSDPDAAFRYEWGVKLAEEQSAVEAAHDNDKFAEKGQQYVTQQLWGVNLKQPKPDIAPLATANSGGGAEKVQNASSIFGDTMADGAKSGAKTAPNNSAEKSSLKDTTVEDLSPPSCRTDSSDVSTATQQESGDASSYLSSEELRKIMKTSPDMLKETIIADDEFNIPEGVGLDTEITAWRNLMMRSVPKDKENYLSPDNVKNLKISIRPEAPQPKLDMRVVVSATEDDLKNKKVEQLDSGYMLPKSTEVKKVRSLQRSDSYSVGKKLHTMSTQIRYVHRHTNSIIQRHVGLFSSNCVSINRPKMKCPGFMPAFSTEPEDSESKNSDAINEALNQQTPKQQIDSKSQNEENSNDPNLNNISNSNQPHLFEESQTFSSNNQEQTDADFAKTLDVIADKEMEISINQLQNTGHLSDSIVSSEFTQKDKSRYKDEDVQDEIKHYEESYMDLHNKDATKPVDLNDLSIDNKSNAIKSVKGDSKLKDDNVTVDSNVKDTNDDSNKEYIIDGDYVRLPGDPYPYSRENLYKWHVPHSKELVYKPSKREASCSSDSPTVARSTLRNANDAYTNAAGEPRDSHAGNAVMETSGSGGDGGVSARKRMGQAHGFHVSSRDQRVVSDCLRGDAADTMGLRQWTEAFSRLGEKINEAARSSDNAPFRARYE